MAFKASGATRMAGSGCQSRPDIFMVGRPVTAPRNPKLKSNFSARRTSGTFWRDPMKKILVCSFLAVAIAVAASAADVTGKWSGSFTPDGGQVGTAYAVLKQSGTAVTGSAGPAEDQ